MLRHEMARPLERGRVPVSVFPAWAVNTFVCYCLSNERARTAFAASRKTYPIPAGTADSPRHSKQRRESSRKSRENRGFLRAVPNLSGVLTPLLGFRTDRSAPWSDPGAELSWNSLLKAVTELKNRPQIG